MLHNLRAKCRWNVKVLLVLALLAILPRASYISMSVQTSGTQINIPSTYTFTINRMYDPVNFTPISSPTIVPLNTLIIITLPAQFVTIATTSTLTCINSATGQSLTCNVNVNAKTITITDYYSSNTTLSNGLLIIKVYNLINAYKASLSDNFLWQILAPNGSTIDQGPPSINSVLTTGITFTPGTFQSCTVDAGAAYVSSYSPITLILSPLDSIPSTGQLIVTFPIAWTSDPSSTSTLLTSPSCSGISNVSSVTCTYSQSPTQQIITISGLTTSSLLTPFSLSIANILIPPTVSSSETISIYSEWPDNTQIDTCITTVSNIVAAPFQSSSLSSNDNTTVQSSFTATLSLTLSRNFYYQDSIVFTLPSQFLSMQISSLNFPTFTPTANLNGLTLTNFPSSPAILSSNNILKFIISGVANPMSTAPIYLTVSIFRNNQLYQVSTVGYAAVTAPINSFSIEVDSNFVNNVGSATFSISSGVSFPANSVIIVTYPSTIVASLISASSVTLASLNGSVVTGATFQVSNNQIIFSNIFASTFFGTVTLIIGSFINPTTVQPTTYLVSVQLQQNSTTYGVMGGSTSLTASAKPLISNSIAATSYKVLDTGVTYTISINTNFAFTAISIIVPSDISIASGFQSTCAPNYFSSCSLVGSNLTFIGTLTAGNYQLSWGYVNNPNSFKPTSSFMVYTYSRGWGVQNSQGVISLSMSLQASFPSLILYPSSYENNAIVSVTILLTFPNNSPSGQLTINIPALLGITSATCSGCTISQQNIYLNYVSNTKNSTVTISNVNNVGSFAPIGTFTVTLQSSGGHNSTQSTVSGWTNNLPSSFLTTVTGTNNYRGQSNNFKFQLTSLSGAQSYVNVTIDSSFGNIVSLPSGSTLVSSNVISFTCSGTSCSFNFTITNPTSEGSYTFTLTSFTVDSFEVSTSTSNSWTFDCSTTVCRSCNPNLTCVSCYNSSISSYYILNTFAQSCTRACSSGYFLVNTTCTICDSNCSQCVNASKVCISCASSYFLDTNYNLCVPTCQKGYFANAFNQICNLCTSNCATCVNVATYCLSCSASYYLLNNKCPSTCPAQYYIANTVALNCDSCNSNCLTCLNTTTYCLTCNNTLGLYFQNNVCVTNCSSNYFLVNSICTYCQLPCKLCFGSPTVCASCFLNSTTPIYYSQYCITSLQCPIGHYINSTNSSCQVCPANCTQCTSPTSCSVCSLNYYLYGTLCLNSCPNTTFITSNISTGFCSPCNNCLTCNSSTFCTSCITSNYLYNAVCYSTCPSTTFSSGSICILCSSNCPTCQNSSYCTSCVTSMNLYQGSCYLNCPNSTFANTTSQLCVKCPASCATCTATLLCQTCATSYSLENSQCVLICSQGLSYNQICYPCGLNCSTCQNTTCLLCSTSFYLYNNTCISQCPSNMLSLDSQNCVLCTNKFVNCSICNFNSCLTCSYGQLKNGTCIPCSPGTYDLSGSCALCPSTCATCVSQVYCTTCVSSTYWLNYQCSSKCPVNMIPSGTNCTICSDQCAVCNQTSTLCQTCSGGVYLYNNLCTSTCPSNLVVSYDFLSCVTPQVYYQQFSQAAKIVPFPFTIASIIIIIIAIILKCFHKEMHLQTVLCALISIIEISTWLIFICFEYIYWTNYHVLSKQNLLCAVVGVALLIFLNFLHLRFFYKYISADQEFVKWVKRNACSNLSMLVCGTSINFKFYRLVHSKFMGRQETSMVLSSPNRLVPFSLLSIISILICSMPTFVGCGLALYNSISQDQQFFIALDTITVTGIMILLILMDLKHADDYFIDEHQAKNLRKKAYQEQEVKFGDELNKNPLEEQNISNQQLIQLEQDQGQMALPQSASKFNSTFGETANKNKSKQKLNQQSLNSIDSKQKLQLQSCSQENIISEQSEVVEAEKTAKWLPKQYDHHGYLLKYDANNNQVRYDENGFRVEIDDKGQHHKFNELGQEMILVDGVYVAHDQQGYRLIDGKRYDSRGYEVRQQNGQKTFYDQNGFQVVGMGENQQHRDPQGNLVRVDSKGTIRRFKQNGYQVVIYNQKELLRDQDGHFVRQNKQGEWQKYDPDDGFTLKKNEKTGQYDKYNELGFRVVKDKFGNLHYYDDDNFKITILPGNEIVRHDQRGFRVEKDQNGEVHRFDQDNYEIIEDSNGHFMYIDKNGYRVERDIFGRVTLYDQEGNKVEIDAQTGIHRRFNEQGLQIITDSMGNRTLKDKRGNIVKQIGGETFQKYDSVGNKIYLDEDGYEVEQDEQGNLNRYDKIGDRVETEYDIVEFDESNHFEGSLMLSTKKPQRYKYKKPAAVDQEEQLDKLMSNQPITFDDQESQISELQQFHNNSYPINQNIDYQFNKLLAKERSQLLFEEENNLDQLADFKNTPYAEINEPNASQDIFNMEHDEEQRALNDKQGNQLQQLDRALTIKGLDGNYPDYEHQLQQESDPQLKDKQLNNQSLFDKEAIVKEIDQNEPDVLELARRDKERMILARERQRNHHLNIAKDQDQIEIKSVADISVNERSFDNEGVQPMENRTDYDEINSLDGIEMPIGKKQRGNRSEISLVNNKNKTKTVYNYNTVDVEIKNRNSLYDEDEEIQSLHQQDWQEQLNPMNFVRRQRVKVDSENQDSHNSNANTNIFYIEEDGENKDALSDFVHQSESKSRIKPHARYERPNDMFSGKIQSIEQIEQKLFNEMNEKGIKERREFKLSGAPNPLVEYAKTIQANKKSLQQKMYLEQVYKK